MAFLCPKCGKAVEQNTKFCPHCQFNIKSERVLREMKNCACGRSPELYKVSDFLWQSAGLSPDETVCVKCLGDRLACTLTIADLDPFPWFGTTPPSYERGFLDGLEAKDSGEGTAPGSTMLEKQYRIGQAFARTMRRLSDADSIARFVSENAFRVRGG